MTSVGCACHHERFSNALQDACDLVVERYRAHQYQPIALFVRRQGKQQNADFLLFARQAVGE